MRPDAVSQRHWKSTALCVLILLVCILVSHPILDGPFSDDFSYIYTAKRAAETGRLIYNGWATAMLGVQVYLGALFIRLFGFSFTVVRAANMVVALAQVAVLHRLFLRLTPLNINAVLAALTVSLGCFTLTYSVVFFTDLPSMFSLTVTLFCCVRALNEHTARGIHRWLILATLASLVLGSVRQIAWIAALVLVPSTGIARRRHPGVLKLTVALEAVSIFTVAAALHWFNRQPYTVHEIVLGHIPLAWVKMAPFLPLCLVLEVLPLCIALIASAALRKDSRLTMTVLLATIGASGICFPNQGELPRSLLSMLLGYDLPMSRQLGTVLVIGLLFAGLTAVVIGVRVFQTLPDEKTSFSFRELLLVIAPCFIVTLALVMTRNGMWPRYIMSLSPLAAVLLVRLQTHISAGTRYRPSAIFAVIACGALAIVLAHDKLQALTPARKVLQWAVASGIQRNQIESTMEDDGWYEVTTGHNIHDYRITYPEGANSQRIMTPEQRACHKFGLWMFPEIKPIYAISSFQSPCYEPVPLHMETHSFWMRPNVPAFLYRYIPSQQMP